MSIKLKQVILLIATSAISIAIGCYVTIYFIGNFAAYNSILREVTQVKLNYWTLNDLQLGNIDKAIERLELISEHSIDYLKTCDSVVCEKIELESIQEAIKQSEDYESTK